MRRKRRPWHSLKLIVPLLLILPPVGLLALWMSPRTRVAKTVLTVGFVVVMSAALVVGIQAGLHEKIMGPEEPLLGYDVSIDSRGRYVNPKIYPLEREIFYSVAREMREVRKELSGVSGSSRSIEEISPEIMAFDRVAAEYNMRSRDVRAIYTKVSLQLTRQ